MAGMTWHWARGSGRWVLHGGSWRRIAGRRVSRPLHWLARRGGIEWRARCRGRLIVWELQVTQTWLETQA